MAQVIYTTRALDEVARLLAFMNERDRELSDVALSRIEQAILTLQDHPLIGRPTDQGMRALVISRGRTGYVAIYQFFEDEDLILVLAVRHQREAGLGKLH